jgi:lantibiotic transport system permease protein
MISLWHAFYGELLKLKRTLALWMAFVTPLAIIALVSAASYLRPPNDATTNGWEWYPNIIISLWGLLMLPLFIALETALLSGMESNEKQWKHLFALPMPRSAIYLAKLLITLAIIGLSSLVLWLGMICVGWLLGQLRPTLGLHMPIPWLELFRMIANAFLAAWLVVAFQLWLSMRWQNFTLSIGFAMTATVLSGFVINSREFAPWYPYALPAIATNLMQNNVDQAVWFGISAGLVVALIGMWDVVRRDVL